MLMRKSPEQHVSLRSPFLLEDQVKQFKGDAEDKIVFSSRYTVFRRQKKISRKEKKQISRIQMLRPLFLVNVGDIRSVTDFKRYLICLRKLKKSPDKNIRKLIIKQTMSARLLWSRMSHIFYFDMIMELTIVESVPLQCLRSIFPLKMLHTLHISLSGLPSLREVLLLKDIDSPNMDVNIYLTLYHIALQNLGQSLALLPEHVYQKLNFNCEEIFTRQALVATLDRNHVKRLFAFSSRAKHNFMMKSIPEETVHYNFSGWFQRCRLLLETESSIYEYASMPEDQDVQGSNAFDINLDVDEYDSFSESSESI